MHILERRSALSKVIWAEVICPEIILKSNGS